MIDTVCSKLWHVEAQVYRTETLCDVNRPLFAPTSAKMTSAPVMRTAFAVAIEVMLGTITASPGPISSASATRCNAAVTLL
jgi:hypothetical protein